MRRYSVKRKASAAWQGGLKDGKGTVSTDSGGLSNVSYSFSKRFEEETGTNPEELIAAAHASCFAMATSAQLDGVGIKAQNIAATATVRLEKVGDGFSVTTSRSEEHTSELQSRPHLVCRLLLEKKKKHK